MMFDFDYRLWIMYSFNLKKKFIVRLHRNSNYIYKQHFVANFVAFPYQNPGNYNAIFN